MHLHDDLTADATGTWSGRWWLPSERDATERYGELKVSQGGGLELSVHNPFDTEFLSAIHGSLADERVSLFGLRQRPPRQRDVNTFLLSVDEAFIGAWLTSERLLLDGASFRFDILNTWMDIFPLRLNNPPDTVEPGSVMWEVRYIQPEATEAHLQSGDRIYVNSASSLLYKGHAIEISDRPYIGVTPNAPVIREELEQRFVIPLQRFLAICCDFGTSITYIDMHVPSSEESAQFPRPHPRAIRWFKRSEYVMVGQMTVPARVELLLRFSDIRARFGVVIGRWLELSVNQRPALDLLSTLLYSSSTPLDVQLLLIVQAVEAYHRAAMTNAADPEEEHSLRLTEILRACPAEHREWLDAKLQWSNEPRLAQRVLQLQSRAGSTMEPFLRPRFGEIVARTRNSLTHRRGGARSISRDLLRELTLGAKYLLITNLLLDLGFSVEECVPLIARAIGGRKTGRRSGNAHPGAGQ